MQENKSGFFAREGARLGPSVRALGQLRQQTLAAMLLALTVILDYVGGFYLPGGTAKITLSFLGTAVTGWLLGPLFAMLNGALTDVLMWLIKPAGAYFPGYTLSGLLGGLIYGICLYRRRGKGLCIGAAVSKLLVNLLINIGLNTLWTSIFVGKAYLALLLARALKNAVAWPVEAALLAAVLLALEKNAPRLRLNQMETPTRKQ